MDRLQALTSFAKVVELGSFARAAERLGVSTSAVSRQVADLEAHLDTRLLNRTTRRLSLTEAGQSYYERCVQVLADLDEADAELRSASVAPRGTLRITCGVSFGVRYLAPLLAEYALQHPGVSYDLDLSDRIVDIVDEGYDLAVRIGVAGSQTLVSRRIGTTRMVCCAARQYLERRGVPATPAELAAHDCLGYSYPPENPSGLNHSRCGRPSRNGAPPTCIFARPGCSPGNGPSIRGRFCPSRCRCADRPDPPLFSENKRGRCAACRNNR